MNYFEENNKFWDLNGVLGRRGLIVNYFIIQIIKSLILTTPFVYIYLTHPSIMGDFVAAAGRLGKFPLWFCLWTLGAGVLDGILYFPSIVRRVRDIIGEENENQIHMIASVLTVLVFFGYGLNWVSPLIGWIAFTTLLILMCVKGKITGSKPKSKIIKFNWGAFLGTWIWGLFNRTPITLLMLPLSLTTGWLPFMILCGLKGNEWAYENNQKYTQPEDFHKAQSTQATVWAILTPFIAIIGFILLVIGSGIALNNYSKSHPDFMTKLDKISQEYQEMAVKTNFTKIELTDNEYKFYMEPQIWVKLPDNSKKSMLRVAANYVVNEKKIDTKKDKNAGFKIINKVKIYSSFNNELLGELSIDIEKINKLLEKANKGEKGAFKEYMHAYSGNYKFNNNPSVP